MRAVLQRVRRAEVRVGTRVVGRIGRGLLVLVGIAAGDSEEAGKQLAEKIVNLRVFDDAEGRMNRSLVEADGEVLCVSQFTLYGDCKKGRRPSFTEAEEPTAAKNLYDRLVAQLRDQKISVQTGEFQAKMEVHLINDGPVTLLLDTK